MAKRKQVRDPVLRQAATKRYAVRKALRKQGLASPLPPATVEARIRASLPACTELRALDFGRLLLAGVPPLSAIQYMFDDTDPVWGAQVVEAWVASPALRSALATLNGGEWHVLDKDARLSIALDKAYAEQAYFLYTHKYATVEGTDLKKYDSALSAIRQKVEGFAGDAGDALDGFTKFLSAVAAGTATLTTPPDLSKTVSVEEYLNSVLDSTKES